MVSLANNYAAGWTRVAMGTTGLIVGPWALQVRERRPLLDLAN